MELLDNLADRLRRRWTDYTPGVGRVFMACRSCRRTVPYWRVYGKTAPGTCVCGHTFVVARQIPEWRAACWLLWGYVTKRGDPRMPLRQAPNKYA